MGIPRPLISVLLALSVLAGQWLAATHDTDHGLTPGAAHSCAICAYAHGAGSGALPVLPGLSLEVARALPAAPTLAAVDAAVLRLQPIRGPPQLA